MSIKLMKKRWVLETTDEEKDCNDVVDMDLDFEENEKKSEMPSFIRMTTNEILCDEHLIREAKVMRCYCEPTEEDINLRRGCGPGCINRELFTECGSRCPCGRGCSNRRFRNMEYAKVEAFDAGVKGWGLRAAEQIEVDRFIIEYVGQVISAEEMQRRLYRYGKDPKHVHHYFMALKNGAVIDATGCGNYSRFINHSCDPNCETQKWAVGGQLRIGLFAVKPISPGEEIVFDYQLERYGRNAQRCYCGAKNCRGLIGEDSENESEEKNGNDIEESQDGDEDAIVEVEDKKTRNGRRLSHDEKTNNIIRRQMKKPPVQRNSHEKALKAMIARGVPRNSEHVKAIAVLMVQVEQAPQRYSLLCCFHGADSDVLRLLMQHCGLGLLYIFLATEYPTDDKLSVLKLKVAALGLLEVMPITSRNQINDTQLLRTVTKLANPSESVDADVVEEVVQRMLLTICGESPSTSYSRRYPGDSTVAILDNLRDEMLSKAKNLSAKWKSLGEDYRIPRRERSSSPSSARFDYSQQREEWDWRRRRVIPSAEKRSQSDKSYRRRIVPRLNPQQQEALIVRQREMQLKRMQELVHLHKNGATAESSRLSSDAESRSSDPTPSRHSPELAAPRRSPEQAPPRRSRFSQMPTDEEAATVTNRPPPMLLPESTFAGGLGFVNFPVPALEFDWSRFYSMYDPSMLTPSFNPYFPDFQQQPPPFQPIEQQPLKETLSILEAPSPPAEPMEEVKPSNTWSITVDMGNPTDEQIELIERKLSEMKEVRESHKRKAEEAFGSNPPPPPPVSPPKKSKWIQATTEEGAVYYYHRETRISSWAVPPEESEEAADVADTTLDPVDSRATFKAAIAKLVGGVLERIRKTKFASSEDYKNVLRKLTHTILDKEMKRIGGGELKVTDSVKEKARRYVCDYIARLGEGQYSRKNKHHNAY